MPLIEIPFSLATEDYLDKEIRSALCIDMHM